MGNTRMNGGINALLDTWIRKVSPEQAQGGRYWSNYTWHGDQNPSHPWWCGAQGSDIDLSDMRFSKLNTSWGKNFVENKMPEAHWKLECIERGARIVVITPEYNPTAYRADYWMPLRPASDGAIFLGAMKIIVDENMHDTDFLKGYTDSPVLVRTDTLQFLDPRDVVAEYKFPDFSKSYSGRVQSLKPAQVERLGGMMVWDLNKKQAVPLHREQVGWHYQNSGIDAALTGTYRVKLLNGREVDAMPVWQMYLVHFQDYDLDTVHQICRTPKDLLVRWARDSGSIKPAAIHNGEGTNHYFHMTINSRGAAMVLIVTGNVGKFGTGQHTWAGNYKAGAWTATPWSGAGLAVHTGEDPFNITLDPERTRQGNQDQLLLLRRRGRLLEPRRHRLDREHAEVRAQGVHGQDAHADAEQVPVGGQRERAQQRQAPLRHGAERRSEHRDPDQSGHRDDLGREP